MSFMRIFIKSFSFLFVVGKWRGADGGVGEKYADYSLWADGMYILCVYVIVST